MKLYFASVENILVSNSQGVALTRDFKAFKIKYGLTSYYYMKDTPARMQDFAFMQGLFLDSGAFSAHNSGANIDIDKYIEFIKEHEKKLEVCAGLDVIGDAEQTYKNHLHMEKAGLHPLPTFHFGEDLKWLKLYIDAGYKYIALGGLVGKPHKHRLAFCKMAFSEIPKNVKVHGYGMTSPRLIDLFPWYSIDSINWLLGAMRGSLYSFQDGTMKHLTTKAVHAGKQQHVVANTWNIIQWKKYADNLEQRKPWGSGGI
jgi:hypothetical protein